MSKPIKTKYMNVTKMKLKEIKFNPSNPRVIKDNKFKQLVKSIEDFPEMLSIRPIVVNEDMVVLGGNMRLRACQEAKLKEVPVIVASELTSEQQRQFIIKDNVGYGEWDWELIANEWDSSELNEWGLDVWQEPVPVDYSILDEEDAEGKVNEMTDRVKRAILIEFDKEDYEEADELIKHFREKEFYIGGFLIDKLKEEKNG